MSWSRLWMVRVGATAAFAGLVMTGTAWSADLKFSYSCTGGEPVWALTVDETGVTFKRPDQSIVKQKLAMLDVSKQVWTAETAGPIGVVITELPLGRCPHQANAATSYSHIVSVDVDGKTLNGCCVMK